MSPSLDQRTSRTHNQGLPSTSGDRIARKHCTLGEGPTARRSTQALEHGLARAADSLAVSLVERLLHHRGDRRRLGATAPGAAERGL